MEVWRQEIEPRSGRDWDNGDGQGFGASLSMVSSLVGCGCYFELMLGCDVTLLRSLHDGVVGVVLDENFGIEIFGKLLKSGGLMSIMESRMGIDLCSLKGENCW